MHSNALSVDIVLKDGDYFVIQKTVPGKLERICVAIPSELARSDKTQLAKLVFELLKMSP